MHPSDSLAQWSDAVAAGTPTPGGGSVAAVAGSLAAALVAMVARLTVGKPRHREVEAEFRGLVTQFDQLRARLLELAEEDWRAYRQLATARAMPKDVDDGGARAAAMQAAWREAARVPFEVLRCAAEVATGARRVAEVGNPNALGEAGMAALLAAAVARGSYYNVQLDLAPLGSPVETEPRLDEARELLEFTENATMFVCELLERRG